MIATAAIFSTPAPCRGGLLLPFARRFSLHERFANRCADAAVRFPSLN
jgi:hypothetical protein